MSAVKTVLQRNLEAVRERMAAACERAGRSPEDVTLVAITKYAQPEWVRGLVALGQRELGESRPQQLLARSAWFGPEVRWHLVGHLQRNKARKILPVVQLIHSVDSVRLLSTLDRLAGETGITPAVLLEVNVSGETSKQGFSPEELRTEWHNVLGCPRVQVQGLMTMAPPVADPEETRPVFRQLRELRDGLRKESPPEIALPALSMGMSNDYEVAVEEGATLVRIGSRLFEGL